MSLLGSIAMPISFSALGDLINHRFLKLPHTSGLIVVALLAFGLVLMIEYLVPGSIIKGTPPMIRPIR